MAALKVTTVTVAGATIYLPLGCRVKSIKWRATAASQTVAGDLCVIQDAASNLLWDGIAAGNWHEVESITDRSWPDGFKVTTLDHGKVDVEIYPAGTSVF